MLGAILCIGDRPAESGALREVAATLRPHCDRILIFVPGETDAEEHRSLPSHPSELSSLTAVLGEAGGEHAVVAASDLSHPSSALIRYMLQIRGSFEIVIPERGDGTLQSLLALYHPDILRRAEGLVAAGELDLTPLIRLSSVRRVTPEEIAKFGEPRDLLDRGGQSSM